MRDARAVPILETAITKAISLDSPRVGGADSQRSSMASQCVFAGYTRDCILGAASGARPEITRVIPVTRERSGVRLHVPLQPKP